MAEALLTSQSSKSGTPNGFATSFGRFETKVHLVHNVSQILILPVEPIWMEYNVVSIWDGIRNTAMNKIWEPTWSETMVSSTRWNSSDNRVEFSLKATYASPNSMNLLYVMTRDNNEHTGSEYDWTFTAMLYT